MRRWYFLALSFLMLAVPKWGCAQTDDVTAKDALILVHGASRVVYKKLGPLSQVYYEVNTPYPAQGVLDELRDQLAKRGWRPLKEDFLNPGLPSSHVTGWQSFGDRTTTPRTFVKQWLADWENGKGDVVVYGLRYRYKDEMNQDSNTLRVFGSYSSKAVADMQRDAAKSSKP
jgi:hypothetical protein